jgi:hypothetical protein
VRGLSVPAVALVAALAACGADRSGGPRGTPSAVVRAAPDRTVAAGRAQVHAAGPGVVSEGFVDFGGRRSDVRVEGPKASTAGVELRDPVSVVDLVRRVAEIEPYGGAEVRGTSTIKYELEVDGDGGLRHFADVWIDGEGRIRRVLVPTDKTKPRPLRDDPDRLDLITVDFFGFPEDS